jgi:hypothetical protein
VVQASEAGGMVCRQLLEHRGNCSILFGVAQIVPGPCSDSMSSGPFSLQDGLRRAAMRRRCPMRRS